MTVQNLPVEEVPALIKTAEDPVVRGDAVKLAPVPAAFTSTGQRRHETDKDELPNRIHWLARQTFQIAPQDHHVTTVRAGQSGLIMASANWIGVAVSVTLTADTAAQSPVAGDSVLVPPNRGTAQVRLQVNNPADVTFTLANPSPDGHVQVQFVAGILSQSVAQEGS